MKKRNINIDILKAICLLFMILGHCGFPATRFIYLFHMPLFFMASGYLFNQNNVRTTDGLKLFLFRKMRSLWWPYVVWNTVFLAMQNIFLKINFYTNNPQILSYSGSSIQNYITLKQFVIGFIKILFFKGGTLFTSAFWFIRVLFVVEVVFAVITFLLNRVKLTTNKIDIVMGMLAIGSIIIGYILSINQIKLLDFSTCFAGFSLFWLGTLMRKPLFSKIVEHRISCLFSFIGLLILNMRGTILLNKNEFTNPAFLVCSSIFGWIFVYGISQFVCKKQYIASFAYKINMAAIDVMALHFIGFKAIAIVQIMIRDLPKYQLARFPVLDGSCGWWVLYFLAGLGFPLLFYRIKEYLKAKREKKWVCQG